MEMAPKRLILLGKLPGGPRDSRRWMRFQRTGGTETAPWGDAEMTTHEPMKGLLGPHAEYDEMSRIAGRRGSGSGEAILRTPHTGLRCSLVWGCYGAANALNLNEEPSGPGTRQSGCGW